MMLGKSLLVHGGLLLLASGVAANAWLSDDPSSGDLEVEVWPGEAAAITQITYRAPDKKAVLEPQKDGAGSYWVVSLDTEKHKAPRNSHGAPKSDPDAESPKVLEQERFIGVAEALEFAEQLAPLRAARALGIVPPERAAEFGFGADDPKKTLEVQFGEASRKLELGGKPPGGGHVYARNSDSGELFVLGGSISGTLGAVKSRLMQRALHVFDAEDAQRAKISAADASRELVRYDGQGRFWADAASSTTKDESASNWMNKFARLNVKKYVETPPKQPTPIVRVNFSDAGGKALGFVQLSKLPAEGAGDKAEFFVKSETTRWWASVSADTASQLEEDFASVVAD